MYITARERNIINFLLACANGVTVTEIAKEIGVSSRTIHREMEGVLKLLASFSLELQKETGSGMTVVGTKEKKTELQIALLKSGQEFSPKERLDLILLTLLKATESVKLISLAGDLNVGTATISNDLDKLEQWFENFDLVLIRKKGHGIGLKGSEKKKRGALGYLISNHLNEYEFLNVIDSDGVTHEGGISHNLGEIIKLEKMTVVGKLIRDMQRRHKFSLTDNAYMTLTIHLSLALQRMIQGEIIEIDDEILQGLQKEKQYLIAKNISQEIEVMFNQQIPEAEIGYITMHLLGARVLDDGWNFLEDRNLSLVATCKKLIGYVSEKIDVRFEKDDALVEGLALHMKPTIYRIQKKMKVHNHLETQIFNDYPLLFGAIAEGLKIVFPDLDFPNGEVAYIVLHFGSSKIFYDTGRTLSALILCSSGIGTSKMLASRVEKEISEITEIHISSLTDFRNVQPDAYDIILSTVAMPRFSGKYILVNPLLSQTEIEAIKKVIRDCGRTTEEFLIQRSKKRQRATVSSPHDPREKIEHVYEFSRSMRGVLDSFEVATLKTATLEEACQRLQNRGLIKNPHEVVRKLIAREELGGVGIPGTKLILHHCQTKWVKNPMFVMYLLPQAIKSRAMDDTKIEATNMIIMLAPNEASKVELETLSLISQTIIETQKTIDIFTVGEYDSIYKKLAHTLYGNLQKKLED